MGEAFVSDLTVNRLYSRKKSEQPPLVSDFTKEIVEQETENELDPQDNDILLSLEA